MLVLKEHPLVKNDIGGSFDWYEDQSPGLGHDFAQEVRKVFRRLPREAGLYSVRFAGIRRVNTDRFPHGIFYILAEKEVRVLAVLHASRRHRRILAARKREF